MPERRDISRPPAGWTNRAGSRSVRNWLKLSPSYRRQVTRAAERGYGGSVFKMTKARQRGELTPSDQAERAKRRTPEGRYVVPLTGGRWTFTSEVENQDREPNLAGLVRLQANMERAARLDRNVTASVVLYWASDNTTAPAKLGGKGGQSARSILEAGDGNALRGLYAILAEVYNLPPGARILAVSLFVFPVTRRGEAAA